MSRDDDNSPAGAPAEMAGKFSVNSPDKSPDKAPANPADGAPGRPSDRIIRHRVDGDVLRVWAADEPEPEPFHTPQMHAAELLRWLSSRHPTGVWVAACDIQQLLYPVFLQERDWPYQPLSTVLSHLGKFTRKREKDMTPGGWRELGRTVQTQYEIPKLAAAVVDIETARKRA